MNVVSIGFWLLAIIAFILRFVSKKEGHRYTVSLWCIIVGFYILKLIFQTLFEGSHVYYPIEVLPLNLQVLATILFILWIKDSLDSKKTEEFLSGIPFQVGMALASFGYIIGALFFGYYFTQYLTGIMGLACAFFFFYTERGSSYSRFVYVTIVFTMLLFVYYFGMTYFHADQVNVQSVRESILNYPIVVIFLLFLAVNMKRRGAFSEKKFALIAKFSISLVVATFIFRHPDINIENLKIVKDGLKYIVATSDLGLVGYSLVSVYKASKYLV